ncbi:uncharacterized protein LOC120339055 [Styela clava]
MARTIISFYILAGISLIGSCQDLTCEGDFSVPRYESGERFITSIGQKNYDCSCRGVDCEQITCIVLQSTSDTPESRETCRDSKTGLVYARGTSFVRYLKNEKILQCTCSSIGPLKIKCKSPQCVIPPPPPPTRSHLRRNGSCYDRHTDDWHPYNVVYTRRVIMSYAPDIIGEYKCLCNHLSSRCAAVDLPCCDTRTGRFVAKNERFVAELDGLLPMSCMCLGGRGKIGSCEQLHDRREIGQSQRVRKKRCLDTTTNRYYPEGSKFIQIRRDVERVCTCQKKQKRLKIVCSPRSREFPEFR